MRRQLLVLLLAAVAVIWIGVAVASYVDARHEIDELLDAHLAQSSTLLIAQAGHDLDEIDEHVPKAGRYARRVAFQFWEDGTRQRLRSSNAPRATRRRKFARLRVFRRGDRLARRGLGAGLRPGHPFAHARRRRA